jgi:hypothetical protein
LDDFLKMYPTHEPPDVLKNTSAVLSEIQLPATVKEAISSNLSEEWYNGMLVEYESLKNQQT